MTARRPFEFGVQLSNANSSVAWIVQAQKAELLGYSVVALPDSLDPHVARLPTLGAIAASTTSIRLSTLAVVNDWQDPVLLASEAATLDWLSNGRLAFGIGADCTSHDVQGLRTESPELQTQPLADALKVIKDLLAQSASRPKSGEHRRQARVQTRPPLIAVGAGCRNALIAAAQQADIAVLQVNLESSPAGGPNKADLSIGATEQRLGWLRAAAGDRFDSIELGLRVSILAVGDRTDAPDRLGRRWHLTGRELLESPHALVGDINQISESLLERREQFGFSQFWWTEPDLEAMAPVVRRLANT